jgi:signal transduction histidine kinase
MSFAFDEVEEILAASRLVGALVLACLLGPYAWPFGAFGTMLLMYIAYAGLLYVAVRRGATLGWAAQAAVHVVDLAAPLAIAAAGDNVTRIWYAASALYLVPLVHAAIRWGSTITLATMAAAVVAALVHTGGRSSAASSGSNEAVDYLLIAGCLVTFIGLLDQRRAAHQTMIDDLQQRGQAARGFKSSLVIVLDTLTSAFHARGARVTVRRIDSGQRVCWEFTAADRQLSCTEGPHSRELELTAPDAPGWLTAAFTAGNYSGLVEMLDPQSGGRRSPRAVGLLTRIVRELTPTVYGAYVQSCTRARASKEERAQLARELHDGPIQSLIGAEMGLEALRRHADLDGTTAAFDVSLSQAQHILRQEIVNLRELMVRMRPLDLPPGSLPTYLARAVRRFSQESGIRAEFVAEDRSAEALPRQQAIAFARIVHEALTNVRKHSGATRVVVSLQTDTDATHLVIHDNGRGFDLQQPYTSPEFIGDAVRGLGGDLTIDSSPGCGVRLDIVVPSDGRAPALQQVAS